MEGIFVLEPSSRLLSCGWNLTVEAQKTYKCLVSSHREDLGAKGRRGGEEEEERSGEECARHKGEAWLKSWAANDIGWIFNGWDHILFPERLWGSSSVGQLSARSPAWDSHYRSSGNAQAHTHGSTWCTHTHAYIGMLDATQNTCIYPHTDAYICRHLSEESTHKDASKFICILTFKRLDYLRK